MKRFFVLLGAVLVGVAALTQPVRAQYTRPATEGLHPGMAGTTLRLPTEGLHPGMGMTPRLPTEGLHPGTVAVPPPAKPVAYPQPSATPIAQGSVVIVVNGQVVYQGPAPVRVSVGGRR
jgi:hypothetical protein